MTTQSGRLASLGLAIVLAIGAGTAWLCVVGGGLTIVDEAFVAAHRVSVGKSIVVLRDGTAVINVVRWQAGDELATCCYTLDGKPRGPIDSNSVIPGRILWEPLSPGWVGNSWNRRIAYLGANSRDHVRWYFVCDGAPRGHGYFVGYDAMTKRKVGCLGRNGFRRDDPPTDEQFPASGNISTLLIYRVVKLANQPNSAYTTNSLDLDLLTRDGLVRVDLVSRKVKVLRNDSDLISAARVGDGTLLLRTRERVLVLDADGNEIGVFSLPAELRRKDFQWYPLGKDRALVQSSWNPIQLSWNESDLFWLNAGGKIVHRERVDLENGSRQTSLLYQAAMLLVVPSPGVLAVELASVSQEIPQPEDVGYLSLLGRAWKRLRGRLVFAAAVGIVLAAVCYRRQRKYGLPWTWVWTGFVLLFGLPAFFGYLAHRTWPARLPCPHCGRPVPRDRPACFACGRDFPAPAMKGIEVFA
jgi:hypothetical protein